jgi:lipopolysaccharide transport system permease protein
MQIEGARAPALNVPDFTVRRPTGRGWHPASNILELAQYADLLRTLTSHRIRVRYKQSLLGLAWAVLQPIAMMLIFTLVFGRIARVDSEGVPYPLFAFTGLLLWSFVSTTLSNATHALVAHAALVTKVYFPREILPLSYVGAALFDLLVGSSVLVALLAWYGHPFTPRLLLAVPAVGAAAILVTAIAFVLSALQVRFRDIGLAVPLALYLWMFCTPIAYPLSSVPANFRGLFALNPLTGIVESFRQAILFQRGPQLSLLLPPAIAAVVFLPIAYAIFKRGEATMADVI